MQRVNPTINYRLGDNDACINIVPSTVANIPLSLGCTGHEEAVIIWEISATFPLILLSTINCSKKSKIKP